MQIHKELPRHLRTRSFGHSQDPGHFPTKTRVNESDKAAAISQERLTEFNPLLNNQTNTVTTQTML